MGTSTRRRRRRVEDGPTAPTPGTAADVGPDADPAEVARGLLLRSLAASPKSRAQLAELLESRGVPVDVATTCLDRFEELRLIDDAEFARMWVRSRHAYKGLSRRALRYELEGKGVSRDLIDDALTIVDDEDELSAAIELVRRRSASLQGLPPATVRRRLMGALARKGYSSAVSHTALRAAAVDEDDPSV